MFDQYLKITIFATFFGYLSMQQVTEQFDCVNHLVQSSLVLLLG